MKDDLSAYMARPKRYDNIDGTGEMFLGLMLLGFALIGFLQRHMPEQSFWMRHNLLFMYAILGPVLGLGFLVQKVVKRQITIPRTGYVALGSSENPVATKAKGWAYGAVLGAVFAIALSIVFVPLVIFGRKHTLSLEVGRLLYAGLFVVVYGFWVTRMGQGQRWKWGMLVLSALVMLALIIVIPIEGGFFDSFFPLSALTSGLAWIISGLGTLIVYLCKHPVTASAE